MGKSERKRNIRCWLLCKQRRQNANANCEPFLPETAKQTDICHNYGNRIFNATFRGQMSSVNSRAKKKSEARNRESVPDTNCRVCGEHLTRVSGLITGSSKALSSPPILRSFHFCRARSQSVCVELTTSSLVKSTFNPPPINAR